MLDLFKLPPHLVCKMCVCVFSSLLHHPFLSISCFLLFSVKWFSCMPSSEEKKLQCYAISQLGMLSKTMFPSSLSIPLFFSVPLSLSTSPCVTVLDHKCYSVAEKKKKVRQFPVYAIFHVIFLRVTDTPPGDWGEQSNPLPLTEASNPASPEGLR